MIKKNGGILYILLILSVIIVDHYYNGCVKYKFNDNKLTIVETRSK